MTPASDLGLESKPTIGTIDGIRSLHSSRQVEAIAKMNRAKPKKGRKEGNPRHGFRSNNLAFIIVCDSGDECMNHVNVFCSNDGSWRVIIYHPDSLKWWDRVGKAIRARIGPPKEPCHALVVYKDDRNATIHKAAKSIGEWVDIASLALLNPPEGAKSLFEIAMRQPGTVIVVPPDVLSSHTSLRNLWSFQDKHSDAKRKLEYDQAQSVCEWEPLVWRWNKERIAELYVRSKAQAEGSQSETSINSKRDSDRDENVRTRALELNFLRKDIEKKAATLLENPETRATVEFVLCSSPDPFLFGRVYASVTHQAPHNGKYLMAAEGSFLDAIQFAATTDCSAVLGNVQALTTRPDERFSIPIVDPMITATLLPSLFPLSSEQSYSARFDLHLGSRRIWPEHSALKACIVYMFDGQSGYMRDLARQVVQTALPNVWDALFKEEPEEEFLRALLHPEVIDLGRLHRRLDDTRRLMPIEFEVKARIYSLARFFRTLRDSMQEFLNDPSIIQALASCTNLVPETVALIGTHCLEQNSLSMQACEKAFLVDKKGVVYDSVNESLNTCTENAEEATSMLRLFLNRDRRNAIDSARIGFDELPEQGTNKILIDCAMYCGEIQWFSKDDDVEDGTWTCKKCLHRWQKRAVREAFKPRKLEHPLKLVPFSRHEYYDPQEWDEIMEVTCGNVKKLGLDYFWGKCSNEECGRICPAVSRSGACAATDGTRLADFPESVTLHDGTIIYLRSSLAALGPLGTHDTVISRTLEKYFNTAEKLMYLPGPIRRQVRNCIDKSTYILPRGVLCDTCGALGAAVEEYCPKCGMGFEPVFACVHYSCPRCKAHFCKACQGIDGIHFSGVYNKCEHACWRILGNRYSYHNKGHCARCSKERPWPKSHSLVSAGPEISAKASRLSEEMPLEKAIMLQSENLTNFTKTYQQGVHVSLIT